MKTRFFIMAAVSLGLTILAFQGLSDDSIIKEQKNYYLQRIDDEIEEYSCKVNYTTSRSKNLQIYGEKAALKAAYLSKNKDSLAEEMVVQKVSMRPHAVHQYLLQRCNQEVASTAIKKSHKNFMHLDTGVVAVNKSFH